MKKSEAEARCGLVFHALGDRTRLRILKLLRGKECCVSEICANFEMTQPSISHHLDVLKRAGLVKNEKRGREVYYRYDRATLLVCCGMTFADLDIRLEKG